ncbi:citrate lyase subunit beta/citryl-CoA lyase [Jatrophihabitans sp. GAS493]|uniref:HpcH/HpaI aldolase/citrate lyase family protein n=1 Tax=Jatrophihabitans sp. GAS493 TaxID=1907575 RepID=UPI000BB7B15F|nr:CoA ester lyase [Jatrophihabitans sp. GAS493]SOD70837.1 citrate lyase subunit beta/citryl-CoA lyase [Jatrophihabitans sp. GAS493]
MSGEIVWLFCPADRPERFAKAAAIADIVILDLEDGVAAADKIAARAALEGSVGLDPQRVVVRVNPVDTPEHAADLEALAATQFRRIMLAKAESPGQLQPLSGYRITALCETPAGVQQAPALAGHPSVEALMWGAEDLLAGLGGTSSRFADGRYREVARYARSRVLIAAAAAGKRAIDSVYLDIPDLDGLSAEADDARASGFASKAAIHPSQVEVIRRSYAATPEELSWAVRVVAAAEQERGVFAFEGKMVDEPVLRHARRLLDQS